MSQRIQFTVGSLILMLIVALGVFLSIPASGVFGFTYPVDDAYIHLAIAQQFWESGSFSPQAGAFCMSSSSPGYSVLLALVGGVLQFPYWLPLLLNCIAGIGFLWLFTKPSTFETKSPAPPNQLQILLTITCIVLIPLHLLILNGMEHAWQLWVNLWLLQLTAQHYLGKGNVKTLGLAAGLSTLFRYEGLFLAGALGFLFILKRRFKEGLVLIGSALLPVFIIGTYSIIRGGTFLPLTLLGKGQAPWHTGLMAWIGNGVEVLYAHPFMLVLLIGLLALAVIRANSIQGFLAQALALCMLPQIWLAQVGGYRYEAYLIGLGLWLLLPFAFSFFDWKKIAHWALGLAFLFPFILRAGYFTFNHNRAVHDIAFQHRATADFLKRYYDGKAVVLNDIGAVSYETTCRITDLNGISDQAVMKAKLAGICTPAFIDSVTRARGAVIAAVHKQFVQDAIPDHWIEVGSWELPSHFMTADPKLTWYGLNEEEASLLRERLE